MDTIKRKIIEDYESGFGLRKLAAKYHFGHMKIRQTLTDNNVKIRRLKKRQTKTKKKGLKSDISLFSLPVEIYSYWIGYVISKGYFSKSGSYRIQLRIAQKDIGHLFLLARDLRLNKTPVRRKNYADLTIYNKDLFVSFQNYIGFDIDKLSERDWLRGLFDGHGSIIPGKFLRIRYYNKCQRILEYIMDYCSCGYISGHHYCVNGLEAITLGKHLYCNSVRYLQRKAMVVQGFMRQI